MLRSPRRRRVSPLRGNHRCASFILPPILCRSRWFNRKLTPHPAPPHEPVVGQASCLPGSGRLEACPTCDVVQGFNARIVSGNSLRVCKQRKKKRRPRFCRGRMMFDATGTDRLAFSGFNFFGWACSPVGVAGFIAGVEWAAGSDWRAAAVARADLCVRHRVIPHIKFAARRVMSSRKQNHKYENAPVIYLHRSSSRHHRLYCRGRWPAPARTL